ncbi:flavodoxin FldB [Balneatrix alpica]|uniref:Flavodoxin n=1 Tax=Balneatrix alpica TaxID=75684 RepID=A0ABV5ZFE9_9GAMM|nr:flavodoxin FldB [Balneatrix alpica]
MSIAVFYGSTTGNTEEVGNKIVAKLSGLDIDTYNVSDTPVAVVEAYDLIIFGIPTWDYGEIQENWLEVWEEVDDLDLSGKTVAFYGLGDQYGYPEWFLDAMGMLHDKVVARGAKVVGHWPVEGYEFEASKALTADGKHFVGLAIDEDWQRDQTDERITRWTQQLLTETGLST